jgi:predicted O-linked N-acetylglucosamine transferase (SPINDLY family)
MPDTGFIFTAFNNLHKLGPEIFSIWMRLLHAVEGSVLWISSPSPAGIANLRREAAARGVAPERLVFARFQEGRDDHLARHSLGDLFLDTLPYNAHSTASDALWAGLPVLTCQGESFQARVASSLLHAAGLPELVTTSLADYEQLALELARNPQQLAAMRQKLANNRQTAPLFDTARYVRDLERAYTIMWQRQQSGLPPEGFSVADGE